MAAPALPLVFSPRYDITLLGLQKLHPFDSEKYGKVHRYLRQALTLSDVYTPKPVSRDDLLRIHTEYYLNSLRRSSTVAAIANMSPLALVPNLILQWRLLDPMRYATGGTILSCELALEQGWAINLSGGYHHAKADAGAGFCYFADIPVAAQRLWQQQPQLKLLIIDLDAHQGNGYQAIFQNDPRVKMLDVYNQEIYPNDTAAKAFIDFNCPLPSELTDADYLPLIEAEVERAISQSQPDLIIYNAGTDVVFDDPFGQFRVSEAGVIKRDEIVFRQALERHIPLTMVLSGGYTNRSTALIGHSIENLVRNVVGGAG